MDEEMAVAERFERMCPRHKISKWQTLETCTPSHQPEAGLETSPHRLCAEKGRKLSEKDWLLQGLEALVVYITGFRILKKHNFFFFSFLKKVIKEFPSWLSGNKSDWEP